MKRAITGYHVDSEGDWVAELDCGHDQHVRHRPPFFNRPWVVSEAGRRERLGALLDCVRCDRGEMPADAVMYRQTPEFDARSVPRGLLGRHRTRTGTWGRIRVLAGRLRYTVHGDPARAEVLEPGRPGVVVPAVLHAVLPLGPVRFRVEFLRVERDGPSRV